MRASSMPWVYLVNRKFLSRCGGMLCASPALAAYRASMARTPRVEYGFFREDSNRKAAWAWFPRGPLRLPGPREPV
jgi:hypothetical protein